MISRGAGSVGRGIRISPDTLDAVAVAHGHRMTNWRRGFLIPLTITARSTATKGVFFAITVVAAVVVALPLVYVAGGRAQVALTSVLAASWGSPSAAAETLVQTIPLVIAGLAVAVAFQGGLFNIGVEGQLVIGAVVAGVLGATLPLPGPLLLVVCVVAGAAGGALWALIPALLKAIRDVHEVVTTIMMNYLAVSVSAYVVSPGSPFASTSQPSATNKIPADAHLPVIIPGTRLHAGLIIALLLAVIIGWLLYRTPFGYSLRFVGANREAARYAGVRTRRVIAQTMLLSGGLAGVAGAAQVLGVYGRYFDSFSPGYGFDALAVALLGALSPVGTTIAALFFGTLSSASVYLQAQAGISREMVSVVSGLVVCFVAAQPAVVRLWTRWRSREHGEKTQSPPHVESQHTECGQGAVALSAAEPCSMTDEFRGG